MTWLKFGADVKTGHIKSDKSGRQRNGRAVRRARKLTLLGCLAAPLIIAGCAEAQLGAHVVKSIGGTGATGGGVYKVGNPYKIDGVWYYPAEDERYDHEGIASWYGPNFHGKPTANGEVFDQNLITAAHPTLPMPVYARVTNMENGRSIVVRINDRGPFVANREIDLSRRSAELLGYLDKGTTRVRVQYLQRAPLDGDVADMQSLTGDTQIALQAPPENDGNRAPPAAAPTEPVRVASLTPTYPAQPAAPAPLATGTLLPSDMAPIPDAATPASSAPQALQRQAEPLSEPLAETQVAAVPPSGTYVQAGAFANKANAEALSQQLADLGPVDIHPTTVNGTELYRVRVGPIEDPQAANALLGEVSGRGNPGARVVFE